MAYLMAGPFIAVVGILAIYFVFRRKSVEKRSMYSARRQQIEHKVRAARQRTLAPHAHAPGPPVQGAPTLDQAGPPPTIQSDYKLGPYQASPAAAPPPSPTPARESPVQAGPMPWEQAAAASAPPTPAPSTFDFPSAPPQPPAPPETFQPAPEAAPPARPSEPAWTPAPAPAPGATQIEPPVPASSTSSVAGWSIVTTTKESATVTPEPEPRKGRKGKAAAPQADPALWALASGDAPGLEAEAPEVKPTSGAFVAIAQYAVLVVGLIMVLIGVLVMVANSHVS